MKVWVLYFCNGHESGSPEGVFSSAKAAMESVHFACPIKWKHVGGGEWETKRMANGVDPYRVVEPFVVRKKPLAKGRRK